MANTEGTFSFKDVDVDPKEEFSNREIKRFRLEAGKTYRIHFVGDSVSLIKRHYIQKGISDKFGYFRCTLNKSGFCPVCYAASNLSKETKSARHLEHLKKSSDCFTTNIIVYDTTDSGALTKTKGASLQLFSFGSEKFISLKEIIAEYGELSTLDLSLTTTDAQFQKFSILPKKDCMYLSDPGYKKVVDDLLENEPLYDCEKLAARTVSPAELTRIFKVPQDTLPDEYLSEMYPDTPRDAIDEETRGESSGDSDAEQGEPSGQHRDTQPVDTTDAFSDVEDIMNLL